MEIIAFRMNNLIIRPFVEYYYDQSPVGTRWVEWKDQFNAHIEMQQVVEAERKLAHLKFYGGEEIRRVLTVRAQDLEGNVSLLMKF